jgi:hypothetical protein
VTKGTKKRTAVSIQARTPNARRSVAMTEGPMGRPMADSVSASLRIVFGTLINMKEQTFYAALHNNIAAMHSVPVEMGGCNVQRF